MKRSMHARSGLALWEVALVVITLAMVVTLLFPFISHSGVKKRAKRISCVNTLKSVGLGHRLYANDHGDRFPFAVPNAFGGILEQKNSASAALHFQVLSNELVTPKILVCPADSARTRATSFGNGFSRTNVSYFVALDAESDTNSNRLLSGDRNITGGVLRGGSLRMIAQTNQAGWGADMHKHNGNIGLADGSVQQTTPAQLNQHIQAQDLPVIRLAVP
jgi:hypothetical protein